MDQVRGGGMLDRLLFGTESELADKLAKAQAQLVSLRGELAKVGAPAAGGGALPSLPAIAPADPAAAREAARRAGEAERERLRLQAEGTRGWIAAIDEQIAAYERELVEIAKTVAHNFVYNIPLLFIVVRTKFKNSKSKNYTT
jgi:hypothetical protein